MSEARPPAGATPGTAPDDEGPAAAEPPAAPAAAEPEPQAAPAGTSAAKAAQAQARAAEPASGTAAGAKAARVKDLDEEAGKTLGDQVASAFTDWDRVTHVTVNGTVDARGGVIGSSSGWQSPGTPARKARSGMIPDEELSDLRDHFVHPPEYWAAAESLERDHIVILTGPGGIGKRSSALCLLREAGAGPLEVLAPTSTLSYLMDHDFARGHGYLVEDWQDAASKDAAGDFAWRVLSNQVRDAEAHLVITAATANIVRSVTRFAWQAPPATATLAAYAAGIDEEVVARVAGKLPGAGSYPVGSIASIGRRLAGGADAAAIIEELSSNPERFTTEWLSAPERAERDFQEVITLCFAVGQSRRIYDVMFGRLEDTLQAEGLLPEPEDDHARKERDGDAAGRDNGPPRPSGLLQARAGGRRAEGLLARETVSEGGISWELVRFRDEASHRQALEDLWHDFDMTLWGAVRAWLHELIGDTDGTIRRDAGIQVSVARGLALLAPVALAEVEECYLHPWAVGQRGWPGQLTAIYALWWMVQDDSLAPIALRIATTWVNSGDVAAHWTAAVALSGQLGALYPVEAARRLWHLVGQWKDVPTRALVALARLFATLARQGDGQDACQVLELLRDRAGSGTGLAGASLAATGIAATDPGDAGTPGRRPDSWREDRRNRERARLAILKVLSISDPGARQPSISSFVVARPDHLPLVAQLWAEVLRNRPCRLLAIVALLEATRGFKYVCDDPEGAARDLGNALSEALPGPERERLIVEFSNVRKFSKRPEGETTAIVKALLSAIEQLESTEGTAR